MRKPLLALGLVVTTGCGALPVANARAATTSSSRPASSTPAGSNPANPPPPPATSPKSSPASSSNSAAQAVSGAAIVRTALKYLGYPYSATGNSPATGFSCIGFASFVYRQNGIKLPGDLGGALAFAPQVPFSALQPGDLLYFQNTVWNGLSHVAIYIGGGKMVHAEWYGKGVRITSFNNDADDGNYWPAHYMTANRPWTGAAVGSVVPTTPSQPTTPSTTTGAAPSVVAPNAPSATVIAAGGLRLRSAPSTSASVLTVLPAGTKIYILGSSGGYYKVQLSDGTVGWVDKHYVQRSGGPATTVGNPTAPSRTSKPGTTKRQGVITVQAASLNVRSGPSATSAVISAVTKGQKLDVIGQSNGWLKVRLPDGSIGWVSADFVSGVPKSSTGTTKSSGGTSKGASASKGSSTKKGSAAAGSTASTALNVRSGPSLTSAVITVIPVGGSYQILSWKNGWARVRLSDGTTGWVSGTVISGSSPSYSSKTHAGGVTHKIMAGVNVRYGPSTSSAIVGAAVAGMKVKILGYRNGWVRVRLSNGVTGYVLGAYVK